MCANTPVTRRRTDTLDRRSAQRGAGPRGRSAVPAETAQRVATGQPTAGPCCAVLRAPGEPRQTPGGPVMFGGPWRRRARTEERVKLG